MDNNAAGSERRQHPRFPLLPAQQASRLSSGSNEVLLGKPVDISDGGVKVQVDAQLPLGEICKCELAFAGVPVLIPTLMQAQWSQQLSAAYLVGLRFVI
jgi:PilZ domain